MAWGVYMPLPGVLAANCNICPAGIPKKPRQEHMVSQGKGGGGGHKVYMGPQTTHMSPVCWQAIMRHQLHNRVHRALEKDLGLFLLGSSRLHNDSRHLELRVKLQPVQNLQSHKAGFLLRVVPHWQTDCITPLQVAIVLCRTKAVLHPCR